MSSVLILFSFILHPGTSLQNFQILGFCCILSFTCFHSIHSLHSLSFTLPSGSGPGVDSVADPQTDALPLCYQSRRTWPNIWGENSPLSFYLESLLRDDHPRPVYCLSDSRVLLCISDMKFRAGTCWLLLLTTKFISKIVFLLLPCL